MCVCVCVGYLRVASLAPTLTAEQVNEQGATQSRYLRRQPACVSDVIRLFLRWHSKYRLHTLYTERRMIGEERVKKRYEGAAGLQKERAECVCVWGGGETGEKGACASFFGDVQKRLPRWYASCFLYIF